MPPAYTLLEPQLPVPWPTAIDEAAPEPSGYGTAYTLPSAAPTNTFPDCASSIGPVSLVWPEVVATCTLVTTGAAVPPLVAVPTNTGETEYSTPPSSPKYSTSLS